MTINGNLLAWIKPCGDHGFVGAYVGEWAAPGASADVPSRAPAIQHCSSTNEAQQWIETEAAALNLPIKWVTENPGRR